MKNLTKLLFCIFAFITILSCEPEEIDQMGEENNIKEFQVIPIRDADANDQGEILDDKKD